MVRHDESTLDHGGDDPCRRDFRATLIDQHVHRLSMFVEDMDQGEVEAGKAGAS
jgi:hypothetical protein